MAYPPFTSCAPRGNRRAVAVAVLVMLSLIVLLTHVGMRNRQDTLLEQRVRQEETMETWGPKTQQTQVGTGAIDVSDPAVAQGVSAAVDRWSSAIESSDGKRLAQSYAERHLFNGRSCDRSRLSSRWQSTASGITSFATRGQRMKTAGADIEVSLKYEMQWYDGCVHAKDFRTIGGSTLRFRPIAGDWLIVEETDQVEIVEVNGH